MPPKTQNSNGSDGPLNSRSSISEGATEASTSQSQPAASSVATATVLPKMSDANAISPSPAASQPMSKSNSAGSIPSSKDAGAEKASPYGTRSRNRTGTSRPNYAEDKDIDMELFEMYPERREDETKKSARLANSSTNGSQDAPPRSTGGTSRRPLPTDGRQSSSQMHSKDQNSTPNAAATPASSSTGASQPSKKRKAASQAAPSGAHSHAGSHSHAPASSTTRKSAAGATNKNGLGYSETNLLTFDDCKGRPVEGKLVADDGTVLEVNDHVYLVCEPPGEPYYIGRVMEFLHAKNDPSKPIDALRVNWYYRPRDIGRKVQDTRAVFATMHSDTSPLTALRGKCQIKHKAEIANLDEYRKTPDCFWFEKLYDRYIQKNYEVIPTFQIVNVPERVKKVLDERWKYILVEQGRGKELTSAVKLCKRCSGYCASNDSVDCAVCKNTYHMNCVRPPLLKKPSRGFAWSCAACSRAQERKLEARNTPNLADPHLEAEEEELLDEEEEEACAAAGTGRTSPSDDAEESHPPATAEQIYHASLWPYRYLGIHCKVEDALDYDDRIYPRAATRIGPRYQAVVQDWPGRPVKYEKPAEIKKGNRRDKTVQAALEAEKIRRAKRPKWVQDEPAGYVHRGEDLDNDDPNCTSTLLYKTPEGVSHAEIDRYMDKARALTTTLGLPERSTNLEDVAMNTLFRNNFDFDKALKEIPKVDRSAFKEPELSPTEQKRFEEGVSKYGSELYAVMKHIKSVKTPTVVRHYYTWKKTERGKQIWGSYSGRKGKKDNKEAKKAENKVTDDVADDQDDSAFDTCKAVDKKRQFTCKFCNTKSSRQWRRAPNVATPVITEGATGKNGKGDKGTQYVVALCRRCAELWRRYAVQWEDIEALAQKVATTGGRVLKRKVDEELVKELMAADDRMRATVYSTPDPYEANATPPQQSGSEPPRKKLKGHPDRDTETNASDSGVSVVPARKREKAEKAAPPPAPEMPKPKTLPCAICRQMEPLGDQHLSCRECRLTVHRNCYGVLDNRNPGKWICDMCANDKAPQISIDYRCVLCPVEHTEHNFVDMPPKSNNKKKTDKEKEKEKQERESAQKAAEFYRKRQEDMHRPVNPREPLKRTADNNWVHVTCAVWTPEVKFGKAKALEPSEGIPLIPRAKYAEVCKACGHTGGACVACHQCRAPVHVECAHRGGYVLGFDITPVKGSRRDQVNIVSLNGESGAMTAAVWCKDHVPQKSIVHRMDEPVDDTGMNALQLYVQNYKQADLTLTGCARKANLITLGSGSRATNTAQLTAANRRASTTTVPANGASSQSSEQRSEEKSDPLQPGGKICLTCGVDSSPKWYPIDKERERELVNGYHGSLGVEAQKFVAQRNFQCHKCKKLNRKPKSTPTPTPKKEPSPPLVFESLRPLPQTAMHATSPQVTASESRSLARSSYSSWNAGAAQPTQPPLAAPLQAAAPAPAPAPAPGPPAPAQPPALAPSIAPRAPPPPSHGYPPASREPFSDWHRPPAHHSQTPHTHINGGPPPAMPPSVIPPLAPPNHLRPPPISSLNHGPPPPPPQASLPNGHLSQPHMNGVPPSPRRMSGPPPPPPPMANGGPYMHTYHHQVPHPPHALTNGGPPPRPPERPYTQAFQPAQPQRSPFTTPHGSPPMPRDALTSLREPSNPPPPRGGDGRPASGASASPSLANLLS